jgi:hypothetical protein
MLFSDPGSAWPIALADSLICGVLLILAILAFIAILAEIIHFASGYNGIRPTAYFYREAKAWWKEPHA